MHENDPNVFSHTSLAAHVSLFSLHSSRSVGGEHSERFSLERVLSKVTEFETVAELLGGLNSNQFHTTAFTLQKLNDNRKQRP